MHHVVEENCSFFSDCTLVGAVILAACGGTPQRQPSAEPARADLVIPFEEAFRASGHADAAGEPFTHWDADDPAVSRLPAPSAIRPPGYQEFVSTGKVAADITAPAGTLNCDTCHNAAAMALTSVTFPSGKVVETDEEGEARCMTCHQGRESKVSVDKQINETFKVTDVDAVVAPIKDAEGKDVRFGFRNVHYFAAGATLYGSQAQMGYEYDGKVLRSEVPPRARASTPASPATISTPRRSASKRARPAIRM